MLYAERDQAIYCQKWGVDQDHPNPTPNRLRQSPHFDQKHSHAGDVISSSRTPRSCIAVHLPGSPPGHFYCRMQAPAYWSRAAKHNPTQLLYSSFLIILLFASNNKRFHKLSKAAKLRRACSGKRSSDPPNTCISFSLSTTKPFSSQLPSAFLKDFN